MNDVVEMVRAGLKREEGRREQIRANFPVCTSIIDDFRAVFGAGVKPLYFKEGDKEMGKEQVFDGTDGDKLIRLDDMDAKRRGGQ